MIMSVDGSEDRERTKLMSKATEWAEVCHTGFLQCSDVFQAICTMIQKTLEYLMPVVFLLHQEWDEVMHPILMTVLPPHAEISQSFPQAVVYSQKWYQGLVLDHPFGLQVMAHVVAALCHGTSLAQLVSLSSTLLMDSFSCAKTWNITNWKWGFPSVSSRTILMRSDALPLPLGLKN